MAVIVCQDRESFWALETELGEVLSIQLQFQSGIFDWCIWVNPY